MKTRVFIADDHAVLRDGLRALLEANNEISVVGDAANGSQAVHWIKNLQPDVVIIDISIPNMDGTDAIQSILASHPQTRIVILSMSGAPEHIFRALRAGARGYLLKESAGQEVMDAVLAVHAGKFYFSQPVLQTLILDYLKHRKESKSEDPLQDLSQREREVFYWVVKGKTSAEIAEILCISPKTVESYRSRMMHKLEMPDMPSLIKFAVQKGLVS